MITLSEICVTMHFNDGTAVFDLHSLRRRTEIHVSALSSSHLERVEKKQGIEGVYKRANVLVRYFGEGNMPIQPSSPGRLAFLPPIYALIFAPSVNKSHRGSVTVE